MFQYSAVFTEPIRAKGRRSPIERDQLRLHGFT
jgi:hypothetical protein